MVAGQLGGDTIQLTFLGEATTVSGSSYLLESNGHKVLVDCGLFQGVKTIEALNHRPFPYNPAELDSVLLTHAHIHHSGLLPKLIKEGFKKNIYATKATAELCSLLLPRCAHSREFAAQTTYRRSRRAGKLPVQPLYTVDDAQVCLQYFLPVEYNTDVELQAAGISFRYAGENLAINRSVTAAEQAFMNSSGHRANILNPNYTEVGIGVRYDAAGSVYVVQNFISR